MINQPSHSPNSQLQIHAHQLVQLDRMMAAGRGDSKAADELRDLMEVTWYQMTPEELVIARQLSADLFTLHDDSLVRHPVDFNVYSSSLATDLTDLMTRADYVGALRLIQDRPAEISSERATLFRAILYRALGLPEIGLIFLSQVAPPTAEPPTRSLPIVEFLWQHVNLDTATPAAFAGQFSTTFESNPI
jgi:hypothetical protein